MGGRPGRAGSFREPDEQMASRFPLAFIHASRDEPAVYPNVSLLPVGTLALADHLDRRGTAARVTHLELERALDPAFDPVALLRRRGARVLLLDLHWHHQSAYVLELAARVRRELPGARIVVGGFTASLFAREILATRPEVDVVVRGDAELPLSRLVPRLLAGAAPGAWADVPNIAYRGASGVVENAVTFTAGARVLDGLRFTRFELLDHFELYLGFRLNADFTDIAALRAGPRTFYYNCGRGCPVACSFCGGGREAQLRLCNRIRPLFISPDSVMRDLRRLPALGVGTWYTCFDPAPRGPYYPKLFARMAAEGLSLDVVFECWALPSPSFLRAFATHLGRGSRIVLSPEVGSEAVRRANKGFFYRNAELLRALAAASKLGLSCEVYFTAGLPGETGPDIERTARLIRKIRRAFPAVAVSVYPVELEPASPMFFGRDALGVVSTRRGFRDFVRASRKAGQPGYHTAQLGRDEILEAVERLRRAAEPSGRRRGGRPGSAC